LGTWGGHVENGQSTGRDWSAVDTKQHINELELKAAFLTLQCFCKTRNNIHVKLMIDNTTAIACINKFGSVRPKLMMGTQELYEWANDRNIRLTAAHTAGIKNKVADRESRTHNLDTEWCLKKNWFEWIVKQFGLPEVDLFASRINKRLNVYVAWRPDPHASGVDAFSMSWSGIYGYVFPPFSLMTRVLRKVEDEKATVLLVYPAWETQAWFPRLQKMLVRDPIPLPWDSIMLPQKPGQIHPLKVKLKLHVGKISGALV